MTQETENELRALLASPSPESWRRITQIGSEAMRAAHRPELGRMGTPPSDYNWNRFTAIVTPAALKHWPPEMERLCPASWPKDYAKSVERRVLENDTYQHYIVSICSSPLLRLRNGGQAVWLERRFTGGIVEVSTVKAALAMLKNGDTRSAQNVLANGVRNVGKVGCADTTGYLTVERGTQGTPHAYVLEVEIKVGAQAQSDAQVVRMTNVRRRGGCYVLANTVESAIAQIVAFRDSVA